VRIDSPAWIDGDGSTTYAAASANAVERSFVLPARAELTDEEEEAGTFVGEGEFRRLYHKVDGDFPGFVEYAVVGARVVRWPKE